MKQIFQATLWVALATALPILGKAQDTSSVDKLLTYIIAPLNKGQIPTQYLAEKGTIFLGMNTFNGTLSDDNVFVTNLWRMMYVQLQQSFVGSGNNPLPDIISVNNALQSNTFPNQPTPVPLLIGQYNAINDNAVNMGLVTYNTNTRQLHDVPNRPSSPYLTKNLFAACPTENVSITGEANVIVKSSLNYNNTGASLSSLQIDFANGQGLINIPLNVPVTAAYTDTGYYRWTIKATLSNSSVLQCYADYYVVHVPPVGNITPFSYEPSGVNGPRIAGTGTPNVWGNIDAVPGVHSGGTIHIVYSSKLRATPNKLRKPLIVVENMDAYNLAPRVQSRPYTISEFIKDLSEPGTTFDFNSQLDDVAGYDLVFINFNDGMDGIVRNAAVVQEAINRINSNKVPDDRNNNVLQQNVVMGIGTGGLNARYALANMAKNFSGSNTRLLITHDAPHRGQNIAIGLQYLVKFINKSPAYTYNIGQVFPEHGQTMAYFKSKVCKDVLIYQTSDIDDNVVQNTFIENVYQPMVSFANNTQPYKFVATSLGNECATPLFEAGRKFMDFGSQTAVGTKIKVSLGLLLGRSHRMEINLFSIPVSEIKYETIVFARSIPNQSSLPTIISAFTYSTKISLLAGLINIGRKNGVDEQAIASTNLLPIDGVPGSFHTLLDFRELRTFQNSFGNSSSSYDDYIQTLFKIPVKWFLAVKFSLYGFFKTSMYNSGVFNTNYTSLPVGSALDVDPFNTNTFTQKYVNGVNLLYPSKSNNFIAQETVQSQSLFNNASMRFTARNARFMFKEMEQLPNTENCSVECSSTFILSGSDQICTTAETFNLLGLPAGVSIVWEVTPAGKVTLNPIGNSVTLTRNPNANGLITLSAKFSICGINKTYTKDIHVGLPDLSQLSIGGVTDNQFVCPDVPIPMGVFYINSLYSCGLVGGGITNAQWMVETPSSSAIINYNTGMAACEATNNNAGVTITFPNLGYPYTANVSVRASNSCGWTSWFPAPMLRLQVNPYYTNCGGGGFENRMVVSPNPSTGTVTIQASQDFSFTQIRVFDKFGVVRKQFNFPKGSKKVTINIGELPTDMYEIQAFDGKNWSIKAIIKQ